jgi:hypothetical protein
LVPKSERIVWTQKYADSAETGLNGVNLSPQRLSFRMLADAQFPERDKGKVKCGASLGPMRGKLAMLETKGVKSKRKGRQKGWSPVEFERTPN